MDFHKASTVCWKGMMVLLIMLMSAAASAQEAGCTLPPLCCEDVTGHGEGIPDGVVGVQDFLAVLSNWGMGGASRPVGDIAPLSCDGCATGGDFTVGIDDFLAVLAAWGPCDVPIDRCEDVLDPANTYGRISADGVYPFRINGVLDGPARPNADICGIECRSCGFALYGIGSLPGGFSVGDAFGVRVDTGEIGGDVWFTYIAPCSGLATFDTTPPDGLLSGLIGQNLIEAYSGGTCPTDFRDGLACGYVNRVGPPGVGWTDPHGAIQLPVVEGREYLLRLAGWAGARGDGTLTVRCVDNSMCEDAIALELGQVIAMTTVGASISGVPVCNGVEQATPGRWFSVVGEGFSLTATTCLNESREEFYDTRISVFQGTDNSCDTLECVTATDENSCLLQESVTWCAELGTTYFVLVHGNPDLLPPFETQGDFIFGVFKGLGDCPEIPDGKHRGAR